MIGKWILIFGRVGRLPGDGPFQPDSLATQVILGTNSKATPGGLGNTADQVARRSSYTAMIVG